MTPLWLRADTYTLRQRLCDIPHLRRVRGLLPLRRRTGVCHARPRPDVIALLMERAVALRYRGAKG